MSHVLADTSRPTAEEVRRLLDYNPQTGEFRWKVDRTPKIKAGALAGRVDRHGYLVISINYRHYRAHRLAWLHYYGVWPEQTIDHKNRRKTDNWIDNLREADGTIQRLNTGLPHNNTSGYVGVSGSDGRWVAQYGYQGKNYRVGQFDTKEEAAQARTTALAALRDDLIIVPDIEGPPEGPLFIGSKGSELAEARGSRNPLLG